MNPAPLPARKLVTASADETLSFGRRLARELQPPLLVFLSGELGAGKTTLAKGIVSGLGAAREEEVTSPTFTLVHEFRGPIRVFHIDLYRIEGRADLQSLGLDDLFASPAIVLVEWPEKWTIAADWPVLRIRLAALDDARHCIEIHGP
ncbi:MAG TPA: tRNA (adenosine(37)-N6)-threonylcarbamoyltransferase complex ATPase subunit type 1 TsaE [Candidatus Acidoferrales bacterium]|nr:tRNA (adenosine(37)-N6)-threonylcarbamoyltransferase complex ATPase subunit type 1 TsaE [Candidatus Acidoferrales bacterium]